MPKRIENKLKKTASKKGLKGKAKKAYVYGTLNKITAGGRSGVGRMQKAKAYK